MDIKISSRYIKLLYLLLRYFFKGAGSCKVMWMQIIWVITIAVRVPLDMSLHRYSSGLGISTTKITASINSKSGVCHDHGSLQGNHVVTRLHGWATLKVASEHTIDSQSIVHLAKNAAYHSKSIHLKRCFYFIKLALKDNKLKLQKIDCLKNPANIFTKVVYKESIISVQLLLASSVLVDVEYRIGKSSSF